MASGAISFEEAVDKDVLQQDIWGQKLSSGEANSKRVHFRSNHAQDCLEHMKCKITQNRPSFKYNISLLMFNIGRHSFDIHNFSLEISTKS